MASTEAGKGNQSGPNTPKYLESKSPATPRPGVVSHLVPSGNIPRFQIFDLKQ